MTGSTLESPPSPAAASLEELRRQARAPKGVQADIDALVVALRRRVGPGQDMEGVAEVLERIIEDPFLGCLRDKAGGRVDGAAIQAMRALGKPLSPKARELLANAISGGRVSQGTDMGQPRARDSLASATPRRSSASWGKRHPRIASWRWIAAILFLLAAVCLFMIPVAKDSSSFGWVLPFFATYLLVTLVLPALSLLSVFKNPSSVYAPLTGLVVMAGGGSFLLPVFTYFFLSGDSPGLEGLFIVGYPMALVHGVLAFCLLIAALEKRP